MALYSQFKGRTRFHGKIGVSDEVVRLKDYVCSLYPDVLVKSVVGVNSGGTGATGNYSSAGTGAFTLGSAGTITLVGHALGTAHEVYFCNTAGTTKALPTGLVAFTHYYVSTRGYMDNSFTVGTSATGTAGTQINFTGTAGTHSIWKKN